MPRDKVEQFKQTPLYINFEKGDLLYGLQDVRTGVKPILASKVDDAVVIIDSVNNNLLESLRKNDTSTYTKSSDEFIQSYGSYLSDHEKYSPSNPQPGKGDHSEYLRRRACKAAIEFAILKRGKKIHFCLDGVNSFEPMDMGRVIFKSHDLKPDHGFTASELRFIYRNWDRLKHAVKFYRHYEEVPAPWVESPNFWSQYQEWLEEKEKHTEKYKAMNSEERWNAYQEFMMPLKAKQETSQRPRFVLPGTPPRSGQVTPERSRFSPVKRLPPKIDKGRRGARLGTSMPGHSASSEPETGPLPIGRQTLFWDSRMPNSDARLDDESFTGLALGGDELVHKSSSRKARRLLLDDIEQAAASTEDVLCESNPDQSPSKSRKLN